MAEVRANLRVLISFFLGSFKRRPTAPFQGQNSGCLLTTKCRLLSYVLLLLVILVVTATANGSEIQARNSNLLHHLNMKGIRRLNSAERDAHLLLLQTSCSNCLSTRTLEALFAASMREETLSKHSAQASGHFRRPCTRFSYARCNFLRQLWMKQTEKRSSTPALSNEDNLFDGPRHVTNKISGTEWPVATPSIEQSLAKSRTRRLARGDRRRVHMFCKTHFVLEILKDGTVVGNPSKTDNAILEIQSVAPNGVVRFFSPSTEHFLAMDRRGRLYGTKVYSEEHCAFVERIQQNMWATYSSQILPKKKRRRKRTKRNAKRAWYVAIGRSGRPRKANRIRPSQSSAQFLPRPL